MNDLGKKAGYLSGLMEGMDFSENPAQEKLMKSIVDLLGEMSDRVCSMEELMEDLNDYVESIDDDLSNLEEIRGDDFHTIDDDEFEDAFLDGLDDAEDRLHLLGGKDDADSDAETLSGAICPECGQLFFVGVEDPEDAVYACPHCKKRVTPDPLTPENAPIARPETEE